MKQTAIVTREYRSAYPDPLKLAENESVKVGEKSKEWEGWRWCTDSSGKSGWIPESWLELDGTSGRLMRPYNATELSVDRDERLIVLLIESDWAWCETLEGKTGWIPCSHIKITSE